MKGWQHQMWKGQMTVHDNNMTTNMLVPNVPIYPAPAAGKSVYQVLIDRIYRFSEGEKEIKKKVLLGQMHDFSELSPPLC